MKKQRTLCSPLSFVEASDHHGVPQRVHLAAPVVHHPGEPRVDRRRAVAVAVAKQLLIDAAPKKPKKTQFKISTRWPAPLSSPGDAYTICSITRFRYW